LTTAEKATLQSLVAETVMAESAVSTAQGMMAGALETRDKAKDKLAQFMDSIQPSDQEPPKRKYVRKAKPIVNPAQTLLDSAPNAAVSE
jgi:hypothetical protein